MSTNDLITAPWSPDQVAALNEFQRLGYVHPFTCGNGCGDLVACADGWTCECGYAQDWAWASMADRSHAIWQNPLKALIRRAETDNDQHDEVVEEN